MAYVVTNPHWLCLWLAVSVAFLACSTSTDSGALPDSGTDATADLAIDQDTATSQDTLLDSIPPDTSVDDSGSAATDAFEHVDSPETALDSGEMDTEPVLDTEPTPSDTFAEEVAADASPADTHEPEDTASEHDTSEVADSSQSLYEQLAPHVQCQDNATCQTLFGEASYCNESFPGGQCTGCDPFADNCSLLSDALDLSCKDTYPPVCLFACPCPEWLRCSNDLCILKTCSSDADCGPLSCRPLGGDTQYCLPPI